MADSDDSSQTSSSSSTHTSKASPFGTCSGFVPACSNFSIQYNYTCASMATAIMLSHHDHRVREGHGPDYPQQEWVKVVLLSVVFIGSVLGMLIMGYLGDLIGIKRALVVTNALTVLGALSSALIAWGDADTVWDVITASRFVLGVGVGGNYPLSAAKAAAHTLGLHEAVNKAAGAFFWQLPGACATYVLGLALLHMPPAHDISSLQFRILLGAGALPALVVLVAATLEPDDGAAKGRGNGELRQALANSHHWRTLVGTAGSWFLFDVAFYGTVIFMPIILKQIWGEDSSLEAIAWRALSVCVFGMAATSGGVLTLRRGWLSPRSLNTVGLIAAGVLFAVFAVVYRTAPDCSYVLFALLCSLLGALYFGPNLATYVLPVVCFPEDVRATFHGLSAAAAKIGAMVGALLFPVMDHYLGVTAVMATEAAVCLAAAALTHFALDDRGPPEDKERDIELVDRAEASENSESSLLG